MHFDNAEGTVFRPPNEANSFILRVTIGCSHNACTFCSMYQKVKFRVRSMAEIEKQIKAAQRQLPDLRRVFLADGSALVLPTDKLLTVLNMLYATFPKLTRVSCYGGPKDILRKSADELNVLRKAGLKMVYLGVESGDPEVLAAINKGVTRDQMLSAAQKVLAADIKLATMLILGVGGKEKTRGHAINTAQLINAIEPSVFSVLTLALEEGTPIKDEADSGKFHPLTPMEILEELKLMIEHVNLSTPTLFTSMHPWNYLPTRAVLPKDKNLLLDEIQEVIDSLRA
ncbi:radical SAM protein, partial [Desulfofalx alkaliphila]|uniref:radical SAM protein n=1 Tax=Desulfofalx alkaliphila TaxID=105483 RepID=UPI0004E18E6C